MANYLPEAVDDTATSSFGAAVSIDVLANDTDPDGDPLHVATFTQPAAGTVELGSAGFVYTPAPATTCAVTADQFTYTVADGRGGAAKATVTVTRTPPVNGQSFAVPATHHSSFVVAPLLCSAGTTLRLAAFDHEVTPAGQTVVVNSDQITMTYIASPTFAGPDSFPYRVVDATGQLSDEHIVSVKVTNGMPIAADDVVPPTHRSSFVIPVLANDNDPDTDPADTLVVLSPTGAPNTGFFYTAQGNLVDIRSDGVLEYGVTSACFAGDDQFTYTISDQRGGTATASVSVTITNAAPVALPDTATFTGPGEYTVYLLANDSDPDGDPLKIVVAGDPFQITSDGQAVVFTAPANPPGTTLDITSHYGISDGCRTSFTIDPVNPLLTVYTAFYVTVNYP